MSVGSHVSGGERVLCGDVQVARGWDGGERDVQGGDDEAAELYWLMRRLSPAALPPA